jgi:hypothetical protein
MNMAVASFTRFRPSLIPAPENNVRKILFNRPRADIQMDRNFFITASCTSNRRTSGLAE